MSVTCFLCGRELQHGETVYVVRREGCKVLFCEACDEAHLDDEGGMKIESELGEGK